MTKNQAASIRARLKQHAAAAKEDFNLVLTRYGLERLLYRLSISEHAPNFLLKGALLFQLWYGQPHRPTRDADLLGYGSDDMPTAIAIFKSLCATSVDDGINFDRNSVGGSDIRHDAHYGGVRIDMVGTLDGARITLQVDISFGDAVTPGAQHVTYPTLLPDLPAPELRVYPKVNVIAEKLHAITVLGMTNSRMKDFFDLWFLLQDASVDEGELRAAIEATFKRRKTVVPESTPDGLGDAFAGNAAKQAQWRAFLKRNQLTAMELSEVVGLVRNRLRGSGIG